LAKQANQVLEAELNKYGFVIPAKSGARLNQQAGFPLSGMTT
jgi:hypothetical protein